MATSIVYEDVTADAGVNGTLFAGKKFWVAQRVPMRNKLLNDIQSNGGQVVQIDKYADYMIADHFRPKMCPPGSISYTFIEQSLKNGMLADPSQHRAGPPLGETRDAGSHMRPAKSTRVPYTAEEDRILYKWVQDSLELGSGSKGTESGNQIYMELEKKVCLLCTIWRMELRHAVSATYLAVLSRPLLEEAETQPATHA